MAPPCRLIPKLGAISSFSFHRALPGARVEERSDRQAHHLDTNRLSGLLSGALPFFSFLRAREEKGEKERCSGSYCQAVGFLVIKDDSISKRPG